MIASTREGIRVQMQPVPREMLSWLSLANVAVSAPVVHFRVTARLRRVGRFVPCPSAVRHRQRNGVLVYPKTWHGLRNTHIYTVHEFFRAYLETKGIPCIRSRCVEAVPRQFYSPERAFSQRKEEPRSAEERKKVSKRVHNSPNFQGPKVRCDLIRSPRVTAHGNATAPNAG